MKKIDKYYRTLKYLKKSQLIYLVKNRLERGKKAVTEVPSPACSSLSLWIPALDTHEGYLERFCPKEILSGKVTLLHESGEPGGRNWANPDKTHLWNFNLHYLEFLIPLAAEYRRTQDIRCYECFRDYCRSWIADNSEGTGDGWHPYTISLRLTNLWICMDGFGEIFQKDEKFFRELNDSMYAQYLHLQKKPELHLLGNHYFENLKAVMLGALYFGEPGIYETYKRKFRGEIQEQILPDGVHYERSMMYHKIILEDVMRAAKAVRISDAPLYKELLTVIGKMADAMHSIEGDMGHTPLFNDSGDNVARPYSALTAALKEEFGILPVKKNAFPDAGYCCLESGGVKIVMDAGEIAPDYMPGHGHCDGLSFELSRNGSPVFVNSGTGQYQGPLRSHFRSTAAHNTVVIDGEEQSECWGEHRVAGRITGVCGKTGGNWVQGALTTCTGKRHARRISIEEAASSGRRIIVSDKVKGHAAAYFHLAPEYGYLLQGQKILVKKISSGGLDEDAVICEIYPESSDKVRIHREGILCSYAPEFGKPEQMQVLELIWNGDGSSHTVCMKFI